MMSSSKFITGSTLRKDFYQLFGLYNSYDSFINKHGLVTESLEQLYIPRQGDDL